MLHRKSGHVLSQLFAHHGLPHAHEKTEEVKESEWGGRCDWTTIHGVLSVWSELLYVWASFYFHDEYLKQKNVNENMFVSEWWITHLLPCHRKRIQISRLIACPYFSPPYDIDIHPVCGYLITGWWKRQSTSRASRHERISNRKTPYFHYTGHTHQLRSPTSISAVVDSW